MRSRLVEKKNSLEREEGFSLLEIMVAIIVVGIITAIAVPMWINSQNEVNSQKVKAAMSTAGLLIEQEALDNNGLYPQYLPNEIKDNPDSANFIYSYSDARTDWCIQANAPVGKLYIDNTRGGKVTNEFCAEANIAEGSGTPWSPPDISNPNVPTIVSHVWESDEPSAKTVLKATPVTCELTAADQADWNAKKTIQYKFIAQNTSRAGEIIESKWGGPDNTLTLAGWLPGERVEYSVQASCVITNSTTEFSYKSEVSPKVARNVAKFVINPATFINTSAAWVDNSKFRVSATWTDGYCPAGVKKFSLVIKDANTSSTMTAPSDWATSYNKEVTSWSSSGTTNFTGKVACQLSNGNVYYSEPTTATTSNTIRPPAAPTNVGTKTVIDSQTLATPTDIFWSPVVCETGSPRYQVVRLAPGTGLGGWITSTTRDLSLTPGTEYTYTVEAKCVNGSVESIASDRADSVTFTAQYAAPQPPIAPQNVAVSLTTQSTVKTGQTVSWDAVTCNNGSTARYQVSRVRIDNQAQTASQYINYAWTTNRTQTLPSADLKFGSTHGYIVTAKCFQSQTGLEAVGPASSEAKGTLGVPAPSAPVNVRNDNWGTWYWDNPSTTCQADTTLQYYGNQTRFGDTYQVTNAFNWTANKNSNGVPRYNEGYPFTMEVAARCAGVNTSSVSSSMSNTSWTADISKIGVRGWGGEYGNLTVYWSSDNCPAGTSKSSNLFSLDTTWSGKRNVNFWTNDSSYYRGAFPDGTYYWFRIQVYCQTPWRNSENMSFNERWV